MNPQPMIRDWARRLIASEVDVDPFCGQTELATLRVYENLRRQLCAPVGVDGFQALASRALSLAKSQAPGLSAVKVMANGGLQGLSEVEFQTGVDEGRDAGTLLIAQLLGLLLTLLGEAATVRLVEDLRPQIEVKGKSDKTGTSISSAGPNYLGLFKDILLEADQLRHVSERLETLTDAHDGVDELISIAGSIRSIATALDVFTLIRSKAGASKDSVLIPPTDGYLN